MFFNSEQLMESKYPLYFEEEDSPLFLVHEFPHHDIKEASYAVHKVIDGSLVDKITGGFNV